MKFSKPILALLAGAFLLALAAVLALTPLFTIASYRLWPDYPQNRQQSLQLENLEENVSVIFDSFGVPHIEAQNLADLVRAAGFIQARYRGFQLDLLRKFASGRLSEFLGNQKALNSSTVEFDLAMRGWGFSERSKIDLSLLPENDRIILEAFTDGVNQGLKMYPSIEHKILGVSPEPWKYQDTLLVGLLQAWSITHNWEQEALKFALAMNVGVEKAQKIYPLDPLYDYGTLDEGDPKAKLPLKAAAEALEFLNEIFTKNASNSNIKTTEEDLHSVLGDMMQLRPAASNAWAVGGGISASGAPILHNDMHLTHSLPSLIFLQHLKMPGLNISGATMPGLPFMISGYNGHVAWGVTSAVADVVDLVIEKPDPENPEMALNQSRPCPIEKKKVVIKVKDEDDQVFETRSTCNGPILNDIYPGFLPENSSLLAIRLELPKIQESFGRLYQANKAKSVFELRDALMEIPAPIQNVMAADHDGNIAFFATGSVPKRENHRGAFPVPGWLKKYDWKGWMTKDEMPKGFNPEQDYFINANNLVHNPAQNSPVFHVEAAPSHRFDRIKRKLLSLKNKDQESLQEIQKDNYLIRAKKILPLLLRDLSPISSWNPLELAALNQLRDWDYSSPADSVGSAVFMSLYRKAISAALENKLDRNSYHAFLKQRYSPGVADIWFMELDHPVWDNPKTAEIENRPFQIVGAFRAAVKELREKLGDEISEWEWGKLHYHKPTHTFGKKSVLDFFNLPKLPMAGGLDSVWKAHFNLNDLGSPFKVAAGPVYRFSIDLANPEKAGFGTDTGASGWPLSPHYSDQHEVWKKGELIPIERDMEKLKRAHPDTTMELVP